MQDSTLAGYLDFSIFTFKVNCTFMEEKDNHVEEVGVEWEERDGFQIYCILNTESLPRTVFIGQECWNLNAVVDEGEVTRNINRKKPDILQAYRCPLRDVSSASM